MRCEWRSCTRFTAQLAKVGTERGKADREALDGRFTAIFPYPGACVSALLLFEKKKNIRGLCLPRAAASNAPSSVPVCTILVDFVTKPHNLTWGDPRTYHRRPWLGLCKPSSGGIRVSKKTKTRMSLEILHHDDQWLSLGEFVCALCLRAMIEDPGYTALTRR